MKWREISHLLMALWACNAGASILSALLLEVFLARRLRLKLDPLLRHRLFGDSGDPFDESIPFQPRFYRYLRLVVSPVERSQSGLETFNFRAKLGGVTIFLCKASRTVDWWFFGNLYVGTVLMYATGRESMPIWFMTLLILALVLFALGLWLERREKKGRRKPHRKA